MACDWSVHHGGGGSSRSFGLGSGSSGSRSGSSRSDSLGFGRRDSGLLIGGRAGQHFGLLFRSAVVESDDQKEGGEEGHGDGHCIHPHLIEDRNGQQRGECESGGGHAMHGLAGGGDGREEPTEDGDDDATETAAHQHALVDELVTQVNTVQGRFGNATEQTGRKCTQSGLAHVLILVTHSKEEHTSGSTEAGEVPHAHRALDEVVAESLDVHEHQCVKRPVQTERHEERVQHRNDDGEDERSMGVHPGQADAEAVADPHTDRANDEGGQRTNDDHAEERHEDQLDAFGNNPLQSVADESKHGGHEQRHEHVAGIVAQCHRQTEYVGRARLGAQSGVLHARGGLGVHQAGELRGHEDGHDGTTQPWVDLELLGRIVGDHDWQEVEYTLPDSFHEHPARGGLVIWNDVQRNKQVDQRDDDGSAEQHAQNRAEGIGEILEEGVQPSHLAAGLGTGFGLDVGIALLTIAGCGGTADTGHFGQMHDVFVHGCNATADDDLVTVTALRHRTEHALRVLETVLINLGCVNQFKAQSSGTMRQTANVFRTTDCSDDLRCE